MSEYTVTWTIDVDAESARDAALLAREIQRDQSSTANVFVVSRNWHTPNGKSTSRHEVEIDLNEGR